MRNIQDHRIFPPGKARVLRVHRVEGQGTVQARTRHRRQFPRLQTDFFTVTATITTRIILLVSIRIRIGKNRRRYPDVFHSGDAQ